MRAKAIVWAVLFGAASLTGVAATLAEPPVEALDLAVRPLDRPAHATAERPAPVAAAPASPRGVPFSTDEAPSFAGTGGLIAASMALFAVVLGLDLWLRRRRRDTAAGRGQRRVRVDPSAFAPAAGELPVHEPAQPRLRDIGTSRAINAHLALPRRAGPVMTEFRLFRLNDTGIVDLAETGNFHDVEAALRRAATFGDGAKVEVWQGRCRVAVVTDTRSRAHS